MENLLNIWDFKKAAKKKLEDHAYDYLVGGADDLRTFNRNIEAYQHFQIRPRRLVNVTQIDTSINLLGKKYHSPIILAPVGFQQLFHPDGEIPAVKAAEVGRPYIYGLATGGQAGVERVLEILQTELVRNMQLAGVTSIGKLNKKFIREKRF